MRQREEVGKQDRCTKPPETQLCTCVPLRKQPQKEPQGDPRGGRESLRNVWVPLQGHPQPPGSQDKTCRSISDVINFMLTSVGQDLRETMKLPSLSAGKEKHESPFLKPWSVPSRKI